MRILGHFLLGLGLVSGIAIGSAQAQMSPGPVVGPAVTSEAARQSGSGDATSHKEMQEAKDKKDDKQKDMEKAKEKAEDHKKPN